MCLLAPQMGSMKVSRLQPGLSQPDSQKGQCTQNGNDVLPLLASRLGCGCCHMLLKPIHLVHLDFVSPCAWLSDQSREIFIWNQLTAKLLQMLQVRLWLLSCMSSSIGTAGIAIGGDVFPGSTLSDHCRRYQNIPDIKMIVVLGELGGQDEYSLVEALQSGQVSPCRQPPLPQAGSAQAWHMRPC